MKLKNVIKGLRNQYELKEITVFKRDVVIFSGTVEQWCQTVNNSMLSVRRELEESEVLKRMMFNTSKAFLFLENPFETEGGY